MPSFTVEVTASMRVKAKIHVDDAADVDEATRATLAYVQEPGNRAAVWQHARPDVADKPHCVRVAGAYSSRRSRERDHG